MQHSRAVVPARMTAKADKPVVLFLIGARINKWRNLPKFLWFGNTMPKMLSELSARPDSGLLWYKQWLSPPNIMVQQYWESMDQLLDYAADKSQSHQPNWARYMRELQADGAIGIWHETYLVQPGSFECVYGNMPLFGLAAATQSVPAEGRLAAARSRFATRD